MGAGWHSVRRGQRMASAARSEERRGPEEHSDDHTGEERPLTEEAERSAALNGRFEPYVWERICHRRREAATPQRCARAPTCSLT